MTNMRNKPLPIKCQKRQLFNHTHSEMVQKPNARIVAANLSKAMARKSMGSRVLSDRIRSVSGNIRGTSYGALEAYRNGTVRNPRIEVLEAAAEVLEVRPEWMIWGEGEMTEELQQLAIAAGEISPPSPDEATDHFLYRAQQVFPEYALLDPECQLQVVRAFWQFTESASPDCFESDDRVNPDVWTIFWMNLRQFLLTPLLMWQRPKPGSTGTQIFADLVNAIDWKDRRVREYLTAAVAAFRVAIPDMVEHSPGFTGFQVSSDPLPNDPAILLNSKKDPYK